MYWMSTPHGDWRVSRLPALRNLNFKDPCWILPVLHLIRPFSLFVVLLLPSKSQTNSTTSKKLSHPPNLPTQPTFAYYTYNPLYSHCRLPAFQITRKFDKALIYRYPTVRSTPPLSRLLLLYIIQSVFKEIKSGSFYES